MCTHYSKCTSWYKKTPPVQVAGDATASACEDCALVWHSQRSPIHKVYHLCGIYMYRHTCNNDRKYLSLFSFRSGSVALFVCSLLECFDFFQLLLMEAYVISELFYIIPLLSDCGLNV